MSWCCDCQCKTFTTFRTITISNDLEENEGGRDISFENSDSFENDNQNVAHIENQIDIDTTSPHYIENGVNNTQGVNNVELGW